MTAPAKRAEPAAGAAAKDAAPGTGRRDAWIFRAVLVPVAALLLRALALTWRVEMRGAEPGRPAVLCTWHRNALLAAGTLRGSGIHVAVSLSRDGERIAGVLDRLGFGESPRGSSSRGGVGALRSVLRWIQRQGTVGFLTDGPRGPARRVKPGVLLAARLSGLPIVPVHFSAGPALRFRSWDRMILPLPFARVIRVWGEGLAVERSVSPEQMEALRAELERRLDAACERLDGETGLQP